MAPPQGLTLPHELLMVGAVPTGAPASRSDHPCSLAGARMTAPGAPHPAAGWAGVGAPDSHAASGWCTAPDSQGSDGANRREEDMPCLRLISGSSRYGKQNVAIQATL